MTYDRRQKWLFFRKRLKLMHRPLLLILVFCLNFVSTNLIVHKPQLKYFFVWGQRKLNVLYWFVETWEICNAAFVLPTLLTFLFLGRCLQDGSLLIRWAQKTTAFISCTSQLYNNTKRLSMTPNGSDNFKLYPSSSTQFSALTKNSVHK